MVTGVRIEISTLCTDGGNTCPGGTTGTVGFTGPKNPFITAPLSGKITLSAQMRATSGGVGTEYNNDVVDLDIATDLAPLVTLTPNVATITAVRSVTTAGSPTEITLGVTLVNRFLDNGFFRFKVPRQ